MAKKVKAIVRLQIPAGKANPAPPIGPALAGHGINLMAVLQGIQRPHPEPRWARLFRRKSPSIRMVLSPLFSSHRQPRCCLKKAAGVEKGSAVPNREQGWQGHPRPAS